MHDAHLMEAPLILGRYRLLELKGTGAFGSVEIAWDTRIQRRVAIKHLPFTEISPTQAPGLAEARMAAMLSNPSIVQVFDFENDASNAYLIMEALEAGTVSDVIEQEGGMVDLDEAAAIVASVGQALEFAHENQALHLDIKPDNVLLNHDGVVKVADFGMSQLAGIAGFGPAQGGTIGYMPPEQLIGENLDERTDEWAFAALIYEMLTGENPFWANTLSESLDLIEEGDIAGPSELRDDLNPAIDDVIFCALSPQIDERYDSVHDFLEELKPYLGSKKKGIAALRSLVSPLEEEDQDSETSGLDLWYQISSRGRSVIARVITAISCSWLAWIGASAASLPSYAPLICAAFVALAAALAPAIGAALGLAVFSIALIVAGAPGIGVALLFISIAWWIFFGRKSIADATVPFVAPILGALYLGPAFPLVCGFFLPLKRSIPACLMGSIVLLGTCACTGSSTLIHTGIVYAPTKALINPFMGLIGEAEIWVMLITWVFVAIFMAALCSRETRVISIIGSALCCAFMVVSLVLFQFIELGSWRGPSFESALSIGLSFVALCIVSALGAPYKEDGEEF